MKAEETVVCPHCKKSFTRPRHIRLTVDAIIETRKDHVILIRRKNPPHGWALPGGFADYGETVEQAVVREAQEETGQMLADLRLFGVYSDPARDPRTHTVSAVFTARAQGQTVAGDDASEAREFHIHDLPYDIVFDHRKILDDYRNRA